MSKSTSPGLSPVAWERMKATSFGAEETEKRLAEVTEKWTTAKDTRDNRLVTLREMTSAARKEHTGEDLPREDWESLCKATEDYDRALATFELVDREKLKLSKQLKKHIENLVKIVVEARKGDDLFDEHAIAQGKDSTWRAVHLVDIEPEGSVAFGKLGILSVGDFVDGLTVKTAGLASAIAHGELELDAAKAMHKAVADWMKTEHPKAVKELPKLPRASSKPKAEEKPADGPTHPSGSDERAGHGKSRPAVLKRPNSGWNKEKAPRESMLLTTPWADQFKPGGFSPELQGATETLQAAGITAADDLFVKLLLETEAGRSASMPELGVSEPDLKAIFEALGAQLSSDEDTFTPWLTAWADLMAVHASNAVAARLGLIIGPVFHDLLEKAIDEAWEGADKPDVAGRIGPEPKKPASKKKPSKKKTSKKPAARKKSASKR